MYIDARIRRMVWYGLGDGDIAKSLDLSIAEVRAVIAQMDPPPIKVLDENGKPLVVRSYLEND